MYNSIFKHLPPGTTDDEYYTIRIFGGLKESFILAEGEAAANKALTKSITQQLIDMKLAG